MTDVYCATTEKKAYSALSAHDAHSGHSAEKADMFAARPDGTARYPREEMGHCLHGEVAVPFGVHNETLDLQPVENLGRCLRGGGHAL